MRGVRVWGRERLREEREIVFVKDIEVHCMIIKCLMTFARKFTNEAVVELERFYAQKVSDFRSILINFVQLQMHINNKVY